MDITEGFDAARADAYLYIVAERAAVVLAHHVADDDQGIDGITLRDLRNALAAVERTHPLRMP